MSLHTLWTNMFGNERKKQLRNSKSCFRRRLHFEQCEDRCMLATFMVTNNNDDIVNTPASVGTLRQALFDANLFSDADEIYFASSLDGVPITLTEGELSITKSVTIDAQGQDITVDASGNDPTPTIDDGQGSRVFNINLPSSSTSGDVTLAGLTITGGDTYLGGGGIQFNGTSSSTNDIHLTLRDSVITGNYVDVDSGGGIYLNGRSEGGGIVQIDLVRSLVEGNTTNVAEGSQFGEGGGGIYALLSGNDQDSNGVVLNVLDSTISGNVATQADGGGLWFCPKYGATLNVTNTTISGNSAPAEEGGGVWISTYIPQNNQDAIANFNHVTITDNFAPLGGGLFSEIIQVSGLDVRTTLRHTIVSGNRVASAANSQANNITGGIEAGSSYNLIGPGEVTAASLNAGSGTGNINNSSNDPGLFPLGFYGGLTQTHLPNQNSPVVDMGDPSAIAQQNGIPRYDQRGNPFDRVFEDTRIDIGAVEYGIGDPLDVPTVVDVVISGSSSIHDDYSFSEAFDKGIHEFTTVPVGGADTIEVVFSEWVEVNQGDLMLIGGHTGITYTSQWNLVDFAFDDDTFTARWRFDDPADGDTLANPFPADKLAILLSYSPTTWVHDISGNRLDGEWGVSNGAVRSISQQLPVRQWYRSGSVCFYVCYPPWRL